MRYICIVCIEIQALELYDEQYNHLLTQFASLATIIQQSYRPTPGGIDTNIQIYILITFARIAKILRRVPHDIIIYIKFKPTTIFIILYM